MPEQESKQSREPVHAILLASCRDQRGVVAGISQFIFENNGNIIDADQHRDSVANIFCTRLEWDMTHFRYSRSDLIKAFAVVAERFQMQWSLQFTDHFPRLSVWVSRQEHCLIDLLGRQRSGDLRANICQVVSNHPDLKEVAEQFGIPYHYIPFKKSNQQEQEEQALRLIQDANIDLVVLAKFMQILSPFFLTKFSQIINIHHSFLPAFPGASPYQQAFARGVKVIGATAHFVTEQLDEGPIIDQDVGRVSHRDSVKDLVRKGKDLEKIVLARAVYHFAERRILVYGNKTVVFD